MGGEEGIGESINKNGSWQNGCAQESLHCEVTLCKAARREGWPRATSQGCSLGEDARSRRRAQELVLPLQRAAKGLICQ